MNFDPDAPPEGISPFDGTPVPAANSADEWERERAERERLREIAEAERIAAWRAEPGCEEYSVFRYSLLVGARPRGESLSRVTHEFPFVVQEDDDDDDEELKAEHAAHNATVKAAQNELVPLLRPLIEYLLSIGCIRADGSCLGFHGCLMSEELGFDDIEPTFYLTTKNIGDDVDPSLLALPVIKTATPSFEDVTIKIDCVAHGSLTGLSNQLRARSAEESIGQWEGPGSPDLLQEDDEALPEWLDRVAVPRDRLMEAILTLEMVGHDPESFVMTNGLPGAEEPEYEVPGVFPKRCISIVIGDGGVGKSTMLSELAVVLGGTNGRVRRFLGLDVTPKHRVVVLVNGEDSPPVVAAELRKQGKKHGPYRVITLDGGALTFNECIEKIMGYPEVGVVIFDPVHHFLEGDESKAEVARAFMNALTKLQRAKRCTIIAAHHPGKDVPSNLKGFRRASRGSTAFIFQPRNAIGMMKRPNGDIAIGWFKRNFPAWEDPRAWIEDHAYLFRRDPETDTLDPIEQPDHRPGTDPEAANVDAADRIVTAIKRLNAENVTVRQTGNSGLYELRPAELVGFSRGAVRSAVSALVASGNLRDGNDGLFYYFDSNV